MVCDSGTSATSATTARDGASKIQASRVCAWMSLLWTTGTATRRGCTRASTLTLINLLPPWRTPFGAPLEFVVQRSRHRAGPLVSEPALSARLRQQLREFLLDSRQHLGGI